MPCHRWRRSHAQPARPFAFAMPLSALLAVTALSLLSGCASPGPPRAPSLQLPRLVSDLQATRSGDEVTLRFTISARTTDGQPLRAGTVAGGLCRQLASSSPCIAVDQTQTRAPLAVPTGTNASPVVWTDALPPPLRSGTPRPLAYRVELRNSVGRSAGLSDPVYALAGAAPPPITGLSAQGTRVGVKLSWQPVANAGEVLLQRSEPVPATASPSSPQVPVGRPVRGKTAKPIRSPAAVNAHKPSTAPGIVWLQAAPGDRSAAETMDASLVEGVPYHYVAVRREAVQIGGRMLELRSAPTEPVAITWRDIYPPPIPTGLTALGFTAPPAFEPESQSPPASSSPGSATPAEARGPYAVDLIWQPVIDPRLAGYVVYRQLLGRNGEPVGDRERLTPQPLPAPDFHDATALPEARYRYSVTAVDPKGNESAPVEAPLAPAGTP